MLSSISIQRITNSWNEAYGSSSPSKTIDFYSGDAYESFPNQGSIYVHYCYFQELGIDETVGGAIALETSNPETKLLVEQCTFMKCHCDKLGGAIYMINTGECVISEVCAYECTAASNETSSGNFDYISLDYNHPESMNQLLRSNIGSCISKETHSSYTSSMLYGNQTISQCNFTKNSCEYGCAIDSVLGGNQAEGVLQFSYIANNTATKTGCIVLWNEIVKFNLTNNNIIKQLFFSCDFFSLFNKLRGAKRRY